MGVVLRRQLAEPLETRARPRLLRRVRETHAEEKRLPQGTATSIHDDETGVVEVEREVDASFKKERRKLESGEEL